MESTLEMIVAVRGAVALVTGCILDDEDAASVVDAALSASPAPAVPKWEIRDGALWFDCCLTTEQCRLYAEAYAKATNAMDQGNWEKYLPPAPAVPVPPFEFDRYINGDLMAEGVTIELQTTFEGAARAAARIASRGRNGEVPVLVLRSALATPPAPAVPVEPVVKPLEWGENGDWNISRSILGTYVVRPCLATNYAGQWLLRRAGNEVTDNQFHPSEDAAKAAAQSDYETRIRSALVAPPAPAVGDGWEQHPDDIAVDHFAAAMKAKLAQKREEGYGGWDDKEDCSNEHLSVLLRNHVRKGDPVDVGNFAMMIHQRGEQIASTVASPATDLREENERWKRNSVDTWAAMTAMRNSINEHIPMPSIESDLLHGPDNSVFCAAVAAAVISHATTAEALLEKAREALKPFAEAIKSRDDRATADGYELCSDSRVISPLFTAGDLRRARATLQELEGRG